MIMSDLIQPRSNFRLTSTNNNHLNVIAQELL
ncbi:Uncharacterised protein [Vibrio cholerae]|nr:Uncharacterised protein [Vibrio cholerae]CSI45760.1 Uncharacterised protein [Vibrio cholerae]